MTASDVRDLGIPPQASVAIKQPRSQGLSCKSNYLFWNLNLFQIVTSEDVCRNK